MTYLAERLAYNLAETPNKIKHPYALRAPPSVIMGIPQAFVALIFLESLPVALLCGGGSNPPPPPPPCSWKTCKLEWRDDWRPEVQLERCTSQKRNAHNIWSTHNGQGSCPATTNCPSKSQNRVKCKKDQVIFITDSLQL